MKGPCKHKAAVEKKYKVRNFDVLPHENEKIRSFYYFLGPCVQREASWFRPLTEVEVSEDHKFVRHQIPTRKGKSQKKKPHSLAKAFASNRSSERKH